MEGDKAKAVLRGPDTRVRRPGERRSLSRSATRALDVLEYFGRVQRPLRAIEIARALELGPSSTNQLLKTMVDSAHLTFEATTKSYLPSPRLARFGAWMVESYGADAHLARIVSEMEAMSGETVTLTTPNDIFMQIVDLAVTQDTPEMAERGLKVAMFGTAIGAAYLSTLSDTEIRKLATRARVKTAEIGDVLEEIAQVRDTGIADGPSPDGESWSVAAPLPRDGTLAPLVLGLAGPTTRICSNLTPLRALMRNATTQRLRWGAFTAA